MKEYVLTKPYPNTASMINGDEVGKVIESLMVGDVRSYAIVSRIGNRYDLSGNRIDGFAENPFYKPTEELQVVEEPQQEQEREEHNMKYVEIEALIDAEVEKAVAQIKQKHDAEIAEINAQHEAQVAEINERHATEIAEVRLNVRAELIAKLNA